MRTTPSLTAVLRYLNLGSDSHFITCASYCAGTLSSVPSAAVKTKHPHMIGEIVEVTGVEPVSKRII